MDINKFPCVLFLFWFQFFLFGCDNRIALNNESCGLIIEGNRGCPNVYKENFLLPSGNMDVSMEEDYWLFLVIKNELHSTELIDGKPERNSLTIKGFDIELDFGPYTASLSNKERNFFSPISSIVEPTGKVVAGFKAIPSGITSILNLPLGRRFVALVKIQAVVQHDAVGMECGKFTYFVELCNGCLIDWRFPPCPKKNDPTIQKNICGLPQDTAVTCCTETNKVINCYY